MEYDVEEFIKEVRNRPAVWDSTSEDYLNRDLRQKCWEELVDIFGKVGERNRTRELLHKKWKNIRSCYIRELKRQKKLKSGIAAYPNRKTDEDELSDDDDDRVDYVWLQPENTKRSRVLPADGVCEVSADEIGFASKYRKRRRRELREKFKREADEDREVLLNCDEEQEEDMYVYRPSVDDGVESTNSGKSSAWPQEYDPLINVNTNVVEEDEDRYFLLSLLSTLKAIPTKKKMAAKIQILNVLNDFTTEDSSN